MADQAINQDLIIAPAIGNAGPVLRNEDSAGLTTDRRQILLAYDVALWTPTVESYKLDFAENYVTNKAMNVRIERCDDFRVCDYAPSPQVKIFKKDTIQDVTRKIDKFRKREDIRTLLSDLGCGEDILPVDKTGALKILFFTTPIGPHAGPVAFLLPTAYLVASVNAYVMSALQELDFVLNELEQPRLGPFVARGWSGLLEDAKATQQYVFTHLGPKSYPPGVYLKSESGHALRCGRMHFLCVPEDGDGDGDSDWQLCKNDLNKYPAQIE